MRTRLVPAIAMLSALACQGPGEGAAPSSEESSSSDDTAAPDPSVASTDPSTSGGSTSGDPATGGEETTTTTADETGSTGEPADPTVLLYYTAGTYTKGIGLATSDDGLTFEKYEGNPILDSGEPGSFEAGGVADAYVLRHEGTYMMYYAGISALGEAMGLATSDDGVNFTRHPDNPILEHGSKAANPSVWVHDGLFYCLYMTEVEEGEYMALATSRDGVTWEKDTSGIPIVGGLDPGVVTISDGSETAFVAYYMTAFAHIRRATSLDGLTWSEDASEVLGPGPDPWDALFTGEPGPAPLGVAPFSDSQYLYYGGINAEQTRLAIGVAVLDNNGTFVKMDEPVLSSDFETWEEQEVGEPSILVVDDFD